MIYLIDEESIDNQFFRTWKQNKKKKIDLELKDVPDHSDSKREGEVEASFRLSVR